MEDLFNHLKKELDQLLEERDKLFPIRDINNTQAVQNCSEKVANYIIDEAKKMQFDKCTWREVPDFINHPVFLCGYMKSGTTMLVEMLDGHSEAVVLPGDSHAVKLINDTLNLEVNQVISFWKQKHYWLKRMINSKGQKPFWILGEDKNSYYSCFKRSII